MCICHQWELIGLYGEMFDPPLNNYGIKLYRGYVCKKCHKERIVKYKIYTYVYHSTFKSKIDELNSVGCRKLAWFESDVLEKISK